MKVFLNESPPGSGKSYQAIEESVRELRKVLFITERIEQFDELAQDMLWAAARHATTPTIRRIHSSPGYRGNSVSRKIESLPEEYADFDHVIVIATHAAMLRSDFSDFSGWQIIVDEVPQFLDFEEKQTHLDAAFFLQHYNLDDLGDGWSAVTLKKKEDYDEVSAADVRADESHAHLAVFHARVIEASKEGSTRFVICNLPAWQDMANRKVKWCWASTFSLWELEPFDRVTLLGNQFRSDIGSIMSQALSVKPIEFIELPPARHPEEFMQRRVHIHYFSDGRGSSRACFESDAGQQMLREIGAYLAKNIPQDGFIWSANDTVSRDDLMSPRQAMQSSGLAASRYLLPRQAGTNAHKGVSHAAMIYAAKPPPNLVSFLRKFSVPDELWTASVERETVLQFMTRTSVRDPGNAAPVHLWVFDRQQALYLKEHFDRLDYTVASMELLDDGPAIPELAKRGPKPATRSPEEQEAFDAERRRRDAERNRRNRARKRNLKKAA